jgi:hypothetical protein
MSFTYGRALTTDRDRVRFYIGDTTSGAGPLPGSANFADEELDGLLTIEGAWQRTVAAAFERLAASWRSHPSFTADGLQLARSDIANGFAEQAAKWRKEHGSTAATVTTRAGSRATTRVDGYSSDVTSWET